MAAIIWAGLLLEMKAAVVVAALMEMVALLPPREALVALVAAVLVEMVVMSPLRQAIQTAAVAAAVAV